MFTRILTPSATAAALLLGTVSQNAAAMEEIVVNGADVLALIEARQQMFRAEMTHNRHSVEAWIKATLEDRAKPAGTPKVNLASYVQEETVSG